MNWIPLIYRFDSIDFSKNHTSEKYMWHLKHIMIGFDPFRSKQSALFFCSVCCFAIWLCRCWFFFSCIWPLLKFNNIKYIEKHSWMTYTQYTHIIHFYKRRRKKRIHICFAFSVYTYIKRDWVPFDYRHKCTQSSEFQNREKLKIV